MNYMSQALTEEGTRVGGYVLVKEYGCKKPVEIMVIRDHELAHATFSIWHDLEVAKFVRYGTTGIWDVSISLYDPDYRDTWVMHTYTAGGNRTPLEEHVYKVDTTAMRRRHFWSRELEEGPD